MAYAPTYFEGFFEKIKKASKMANEKDSITLDIWDECLVYIQGERRFITSKSHLEAINKKIDSDEYIIYNNQTLNSVVFSLIDEILVAVTTRNDDEEKLYDDLKAKRYLSNAEKSDYYSLIILTDI